MAFQDDWILRQVEMIARFVAHLIFHKEEVSYVLPSSGVLTETDELYLTLQRLLREGAVCEAEDLLFENMVPTDRYIELAKRKGNLILAGRLATYRYLDMDDALMEAFALAETLE